MKIGFIHNIISVTFFICPFPWPNHSVIIITIQACSIRRFWVWRAYFLEVCSINHNSVGHCPVLYVVVKEIIICCAVYIDVICTKIMLDNFRLRGLWYTPQIRVKLLIMWLELSPRLCETYSNSAFRHSSLSRYRSQESNSCQGFKELRMECKANKLLIFAAFFKLLLHSYMEVLRRFPITIRHWK